MTDEERKERRREQRRLRTERERAGRPPRSEIVARKPKKRPSGRIVVSPEEQARIAALRRAVVKNGMIDSAGLLERIALCCKRAAA